MKDLVQAGLTGAAVAGTLAALGWLASRARPKAQGAGTGRVRPGMPTILLVVVLGTGICGLASYGWAFADGGGAALAVAIGAGLGAACIATFLLPVHDVVWDRGSVEGPASYGIWPFGPRRARIGWPDIAGFGQDLWGSWFVEDAGGNRIRWSPVHSGYPALMRAIEEACPHLFPPRPAP